MTRRSFLQVTTLHSVNQGGRQADRRAGTHLHVELVVEMPVNLLVVTVFLQHATQHSHAPDPKNLKHNDSDEAKTGHLLLLLLVVVEEACK